MALPNLRGPGGVKREKKSSQNGGISKRKINEPITTTTEDGLVRYLPLLFSRYLKYCILSMWDGLWVPPSENISWCSVLVTGYAPCILGSSPQLAFRLAELVGNLRFFPLIQLPRKICRVAVVSGSAMRSLCRQQAFNSFSLIYHSLLCK